MKSRVAVLATLLVALLTGAPAGAAPRPDRDPATGGRLTWLVVGDSYTSGEGTQGTTSVSDPTQRCAQATGVGMNAASWPVVAKASVRAYQPRFRDDLSFAACSGQTTDDLLTQIGSVGGGTWDFATLSFGGNNIGFSSVLLDCITLDAWESLREKCGSDTEANLRARIDALVGKRDLDVAGYTAGTTVNQAYEQLARHMNSGGQVVVAGYPQLFADPGRWGPVDGFLKACQGFDAPDVRMLRGVTGYLNQQLGLAVSAANQGPAAKARHVTFHFLDLSTTYEPPGTTGHGLCGDGAWLNGWSRHLKTASFHPTQVGYNAAGSALAAFVRSKKMTWPDAGEPSILDRRPAPADCGVRYLSFYEPTNDNLAGILPWDEVPGSGLFHRSTTPNVTVALRRNDGRLRPASLAELSTYLTAHESETRFLVCGGTTVYRIEESPPTREVTDRDALTTTGVGPLRVGDTYEAAEVATGHPLQMQYHDEDFSDLCIVGTLGDPKSGVSVLGGDDHIHRIDIDAPSRVRTRSGIGIGSTEDAVKTAYKANLSVEDHPYVEGGHYLIYRPNDEADRMIIFETDGQVVTSFRVGDTLFTPAIEHCL